MPSADPARRHDWLHLVPDACALVRADGVVLAANAAMAELAGCDLRNAPLCAVLGEIRPADGAARRWRTVAHRLDGVPLCVEAAEQHAEDGLRVVTCRVVEPLGTPEGLPALLHEAFARAPIGMAFFNTDGEYVRVNAAMCELMGRAEHELLGRRDQEFTHPDDRRNDIEPAWRILRGEIDTHQTEKRFVRPDGSWVWALANLTFVRDDAGRPLAWLGQFQDITQRRSMEEALRARADEDPLTGLPNRRRLEQELHRAISSAGRHGGRGAVLVLDLDGFKSVNDAHGHARGDEVLAGIAARLRARLRATDLLARLGGDEFAVVLDGAGALQAERVAGDLREAVAGCGEAAVGVSIGIATFTADALDTPAGLLDRADREMYRAKAALRRA